MKLRVHYTGQLRTALGRPEEELDAPDDSTLEQFLLLLAGRCAPTAGAHLVTSEGRLRPSLLIAVNGLAVAAGTAPTTRLQSGDEITLLPPIAGG